MRRSPGTASFWDSNGRNVAINATLTALLGQAGDSDTAKFRAHIKEAIDNGAAGPDVFCFDDRNHSNSQIESVCVLRWVSGRPIIAGLYRDAEKDHRRDDRIGHLVANLDAFLTYSPSCTLISPKLVSIVRGALVSAESLHGHSVLTFRHGQVRDVHWRCFSLEGHSPEAVTRVFAFDLRRPDADDLVE
ncbi:MAG: hypothetical protein FD152_1851 [Xanthobacteraceae bacterium]|nr:MAG: hypothetical protein FD152_1851 [Xanthobacteraceae bacterium]